MRPLEAITLVLIAGTLVVLFTHKERKIFLYLLFAAIGAMFCQHFIEGNRWQFALAVYLLPAMYVFHRFQKLALNLLIKGILSVWFGIAIFLPWIIPVFTLPSPQGPYDVGTETFHWVDSSRMEWFTDENPNDVREIMVQVWYPAIKNTEMKPEPYLDFIDLRAKSLAKAGAIPEFLPSHLNYIYTNSFPNLSIIDTGQLLPIVIFSHGITGTRHLHQTMYEHLVSHGYIVLAPDHSFDANLTIFPDGHVADYRSNITGYPDSINIRIKQMDTRAADISFILDQIGKMQSGEIKSQLISKIDLEKIAVGGHSYGGSTATVAAQQDDRVKACFVLDSWVSPVPQETIDAGIHVSFLFMGRPNWDDSDYPENYKRLDSLMAHSSHPKYKLILKNTEHLDYSDIPLFSPIIRHVLEVGSLSSSVSLPLINELVHGFLEKHLTKKSENKFDIVIQNKLIVSAP